MDDDVRDFDEIALDVNVPVQAVFSMQNGVPVGSIWRFDDCKPVAFIGYDKLMLLIDKMSTQAAYCSTSKYTPRLRGRHFCIVKVLFRQNNSIQGELNFGSIGRAATKDLFKSAVELRNLLNTYAEAESENAMVGSVMAFGRAGTYEHI